MDMTEFDESWDGYENTEPPQLSPLNTNTEPMSTSQIYSQPPVISQYGANLQVNYLYRYISGILDSPHRRLVQYVTLQIEIG